MIRVDRLLAVVVAALALLFTVLEPPASRGLAFPAALAFWLLHIGVGMLLAVWVTAVLSRRAVAAHWHPWARVLAGGVAGSLLFAPFALAVDLVLPVPGRDTAPDDLLDQWEAGGGALAVLAEWLQLAPSYLASWLLVNAVPLRPWRSRSIDAAAFARVPSTPTSPEPGGPLPTPAETSALGAPAAGSGPPELLDAPDPPPTSTGPEASPADRAAFLDQLPPAIGTDLIAIQADLHYLHVRTTRGRATLLAGISAAEAALGGTGLRVHRSHWVALAHVVRVSRGARGMSLTLSDGSRVPVSRRRASLVEERLGRDFVVDRP